MRSKAKAPESLAKIPQIAYLYDGFNNFIDQYDNAIAINNDLLMDILKKNAETEFGKEHDFADITTIEEFKEKVPLSTYDNYAPYIERMTHGEKNILVADPVLFYALSSGSLGVPKHIPITPDMLRVYKENLSIVSGFGRVNGMIELKGRPPLSGKSFKVAVVDISHVEDGTPRGALSSFVFNELKDTMAAGLPWPVEVMYPEGKTMDFKYLRALYGLKDKTLTSLNAPFVTALVDALHYIQKNWETLVDDIEKGVINPAIDIDPELREKFQAELKPDPERAQELREIFEEGFDTPIVPRLWPQMDLVTCVAGGGFSVYTQKLREFIGDDIPIQSSLYSCSEGILGAPLEMNDDTYVMDPNTTFYEFIPVEDDSENPETLLLKDLEPGKDYEVVITTKGGLYRYRLGDVLEVVEFQGEAPIVRFKYRKEQMVSLAGEKTNESHLVWVIGEMEKELGNQITDYSVYADTETLPGRYVLLLETNDHVPKSDRGAYRDVAEAKLSERNPSYGSKVENDLLLPLEALFVQPETYYLYRDMMIMKGSSENQLKPVRVIDNPRKEKFFFSLLDEED